ncbi:MAG: hypothetical protein HXY40_19420 [Chloroflexi bacterium]|nr:hypothetical protein [Chloroflexota bacterium]
MPKKVANVKEEPVVTKAAVEAEMMEEKEPTTFGLFVDHQKKAIEEAGKAVSALIPESAKEHGEKALKEMMEGYRKLINNALDEVIKAVEKAKVEEKVVEVVERVKIGGSEPN